MPVDVHEDVDAGVVVEGHLGGALTHAARDQVLAQELGDDAGVVGDAARDLPDAGAGEHRRHRTRAVEPDPPAVVAGAVDADARDRGLPMPAAVHVRVVAGGDEVRGVDQRVHDRHPSPAGLDRE